MKPIPDRLMTELTAHRTLALRHALGEQPDVGFLAALHALCIKVFYRYAVDTCLELDLTSARSAPRLWRSLRHLRRPRGSAGQHPP